MAYPLKEWYCSICQRNFLLEYQVTYFKSARRCGIMLFVCMLKTTVYCFFVVFFGGGAYDRFVQVTLISHSFFTFSIYPFMFFSLIRHKVRKQNGYLLYRSFNVRKNRLFPPQLVVGWRLEWKFSKEPGNQMILLKKKKKLAYFVLVKFALNYDWKCSIPIHG